MLIQGKRKMLYISIIFIFSLISVLLGVFIGVPFVGVTESRVFAITIISLLVLVVIDSVCALFVRYCLPKKVFNPFLKGYRVGKFERKFYERIGVRKWKDRIPEAGQLFANFAKTEIADMTNNEYVYKFMSETIYAEIMHWLSAIFSFLIVFIDLSLALTVALPLIVGNMILNILPVIVQRYNRPKLMVLYQRNERMKAKRIENKEKEE